MSFEHRKVFPRPGKPTMMMINLFLRTMAPALPTAVCVLSLHAAVPPWLKSRAPSRSSSPGAHEPEGLASPAGNNWTSLKLTGCVMRPRSRLLALADSGGTASGVYKRLLPLLFVPVPSVDLGERSKSPP